jgi:NADPH2:quinone reductase
VPGEHVLVHGATGGVGIAAVQLGNAAGMLVIGTAGTEQGRELVLGQGAIKMFDHHTPEHFEAIMAFTQGRGVDVVLEMIANANLSEDLKILAPGGRVVVIGSRGHIEINPRDIMARDADILGMSMMNVKDGEQRQIHAALAAGLTWGTLSPVVRCEMPLGEAAKAHELLMRPGAYGKIVLRP